MDRIATGVAVVGMIQSNSNRQIEVRPRVAGIVAKKCMSSSNKRSNAVIPSSRLIAPRLARPASISVPGNEIAVDRGLKRPGGRRYAANVALLIPELRKESINDETNSSTMKNMQMSMRMAKERAREWVEKNHRGGVLSRRSLQTNCSEPFAVLFLRAAT